MTDPVPLTHMAVCGKCSALVHDPKLHSEWHDSLEATK